MKVTAELSIGEVQILRDLHSDTIKCIDYLDRINLRPVSQEEALELRTMLYDIKINLKSVLEGDE